MVTIPRCNHYLISIVISGYSSWCWNFGSICITIFLMYNENNWQHLKWIWSYQNIFSHNVTNVFHCFKHFQKNFKWFENGIFIRNVLCTPLYCSIMQHLFGSWEFRNLKNWCVDQNLNIFLKLFCFKGLISL